MNSEKSKICKPHILILKLTDKLDLRRGEKSIALSNLSIYYTWKNIKGSYTTINIRYQLQHVLINLKYQADHIQYQIFKNILNIFLQSMEKVLIIHRQEYM